MIIEHFAYVLLVQYYSLQIMVSAKQHHKDEEKERGFTEHGDIDVGDKTCLWEDVGDRFNTLKKSPT